MMKSGLVDAVIIAVPHYDHPGLAIKAFGYGLNVITEKPAGVYTKQVLEMNEAAAKSDKVFGIMYNQRTNPVYQKLREMIQSGQLGKIKRVAWIITDWYRSQAYHDSATWRSAWATEGGGTLINQNPHQLDLWQWLFGMPKRIMSHVGFGKYYNIEVEDDVTAFMEYENGMTGLYVTSTGEAPGVNRLEISCDMGLVVVENNRISFKRNVESEREFNAKNTIPFGRPECWDCTVPAATDGGPQHVGILQNFTDAILDGKKLACKELKQGVARFERDLASGRWYFDPAEADYVIRKIENELGSTLARKIDRIADPTPVDAFALGDESKHARDDSARC